MTDRGDQRRAQGDPGEVNRGVGQNIVSGSDPGPPEAPAPAAGGPGSGAGETLGKPGSRRAMTDKRSDPAGGTYGQA